MAKKPAKAAVKSATKKEAPAAKKKAVVKPAKAAPPKPAAKAKVSSAKKVAARPSKPVKEVAKAPAKKISEKSIEKLGGKSSAEVNEQKSVVEDFAPASNKKVKGATSEEKGAPKKGKKEKKVKINKAGLNDDQVKWHEYHERLKGTKAPAYSISGQFEAKSPVQHKLFGWGFILSNEYDRLEVLFEDGKRMLISNRKLS